MWTNVSFVAFPEVTQQPRSPVVITNVLIMKVALNAFVEMDFCWCTTQNAAKVWFSVWSTINVNLFLFFYHSFCTFQQLSERLNEGSLPWFVCDQASGFLVSWETVVLRRWDSETKIWWYQTSWEKLNCHRERFLKADVSSVSPSSFTLTNS